MSAGVWGLDVQEVRNLAKSMDGQADTVENARVAIDGLLYTTAWTGPAADEFRGMWSSQLGPSMSAAGISLRDAAERARANADAQEQASNASDAPDAGWRVATIPMGLGGGRSGAGDRKDENGEEWYEKGPLGWLGDRAEDVWNAGGDVFEWAVDESTTAIVESGRWLDDRAGAIADDWGNVFDSLRQLGNATIGSIFQGRLPSLTEVLASQLRLTGATIGALGTTATLGIKELNIFDDGEPWAGEPRDVPVSNDGTGRPPLREPRRLSDLTAVVTDAYTVESGKIGEPSVRITVVENPGQPPAYIVSIPGTQSWAPATGANPLDFTADLINAGGGRSSMQESIELAMVEAGVPRGANVMLVGHSLGGIVAADMASDTGFTSSYHVSNVVTFGAPIDASGISPSIDVLEMQHATDIVPRLDFGNFPGSLLPGGPDQSHHTTVILPNPSGPFDAVANHSHEAYTKSIGNNMGREDLSSYESNPSTQQFFVQDGGKSSAVDVPIGRTDR